MKLNKKKLLMPIILFGLFFIPNNVHAEETCGAVLKLGKIQNSASVSIPSLGRVGHSYFNATLNGQSAQCIQEGQKARTGMVLTQGEKITDQQQIKAAMCGGNAKTGSQSIMANAYQWALQAGVDPVQAMTEAYASMNGLNLNNVAQLSQARSAATSFKSGCDNISTAGVSKCAWGNDTGQNFIGNCGCELTEVDREKCPTFEVKQYGSLPACNDNNTNVDATFYETPESSPNGVASKNGEPERYIGQFCYLYCLETAASISLPGGFGTALAIGTQLVWPTSEETSNSRFGNMYSLTMKGQKECMIEVVPNTMNCIEDPVIKYQKTYALAEKQGQNKYDLYVGAWDKPKIQKTTTTINFREKDTAATCMTAPADDAGWPVGCADAYIMKTYGKNIEDNIIILNKKIALQEEKIAKLEKQLVELGKAKQSCLQGLHTEKTGSHYDASKGTMVDDYSVVPNTCSNPCSGECSAYDAKKAEIEKEKKELQRLQKLLATWKKAQAQYKGLTASMQTYMGQLNTLIGIHFNTYVCSQFTIGATDIYNFQSSATVSWTDPEYGTSYSLVKSTGPDYGCSGCSDKTAMSDPNGVRTFKSFLKPPAYKGAVEAIENRRITVTADNVSYKLPDGIYNYVNKDTNKSVMTMPSNSNFLKIPYSNLPTSYDAKVGFKYDLTLTDISLGDNGIFNAYTVDMADYVCHYSLTNTSDECLCPPGTSSSGEDLYGVIKNTNLTCAEAQEKYCNSPVPKCETNCVDEKYCENDKSIKITGCVNAGKTVAECRSLLCGGSTYKCKNTNGVNGPMDITGCVATRRAQGDSLQKAINYCDATVCPLGNIIIYRTIDLHNPFPSKDGDATVTQNGLQRLMFNDNVRGRYPGYNWNSTSTVRSRILNNRTIDGDAVYSKQPLYTFVLDTNTILRIREYNDSQAKGYSDFSLDCVKNASNKYLGVACVSNKFVHNVTYGLKSGTCAGATSWNEFYECVK